MFAEVVHWSKARLPYSCNTYSRTPIYHTVEYRLYLLYFKLSRRALLLHHCGSNRQMIQDDKCPPDAFEKRDTNSLGGRKTHPSSPKSCCDYQVIALV
ncbi:hypothetical protein TNIN_58311 [Trichonephila inaurata madagascariensis]|uniref:Uncharacterized protein n=1 Tax=Trichonephila inaurata madagascariensis TaxID=2747483 RepID=A0A8X6I8M0_9ARAC|nr:hypothetical protein TNIN_58311 [Trichonephila inaurata madagascariensis]